MAKGLIEAAEMAFKKGDEKLKPLGHGVTATTSPHDVIGALTTLPRDVWNDQLGHGVTMAEKAANLTPMRATAEFSVSGEKASHRTPRIPPLYLYQSKGQSASIHEHGSYQRLTAKPAHLFTKLVSNQQTTH